MNVEVKARTSVAMKETNNKPGLEFMINFYRMIGNTFLGWNFDRKISKLKKNLLILWNFLLLGVVIIHFYIGLTNLLDSSKTLHEESHYKAITRLNSLDSVIPWILVNVSHIGFSSQNVLIVLYYILCGKKLVVILYQDSHARVNSRFEKRVSKLIVLISFGCTFSLVIAIATTIFANNPRVGLLSGLFYVFYVMAYTMSFNTQFMALSFIIYKSLLVRRQLEAIEEEMSLKNILKFVHRIHDSVKRMDDAISPYLLFKLGVDTLICLSSICIILIYSGDNPLANTGFFIGTCIFITVTCLSCDLIPRSFAKLVHRLEMRYTEQNHLMTDPEQIQTDLVLLRLHDLERRIGFTAFGIFRISADTLLSITALVLSYTVIVAQTSQTGPIDKWHNNTFAG